MKKFRICLLPVLATLTLTWSIADVQGQEKVTFDDQIKPLFAQRCAACHNPNKKSGDLDVTNFTALMQGGGSGTVIEPGDAAASYLYALVTHEDSPEMPPDSEKIPDGEIQLLQKWIEGGALENKSSKAILPKKKKVAVVDFDPSQRPEIIPRPCRLSVEADVVPHRQPIVTAMATSPWASVAAVAGAQQVVLYDTQSLELLGVLAFPEGQVNVLKFSRNGTLLLAAGGRGAANGVAIAWDIQTGERVIEIKGEADAILAADINKDHSLIAVGGSQRLVKVFDTETGKLKFEMKKHTDWVQAIEFSPDGVLLASGDRSGGVLVWEAMTGREYLDLRGHSGPINDVSWRIDSNVLATASGDTSIKLWEMENGGQIKTWNAHGGGVQDVEFTRDSRIVSCGRDNHAKVFDQNGGQQKAYPVQQYATAVTHCDETDRLITGNFGAAVTVHQLADDQMVGQLSQNPPSLEARLADVQKQLQEVKAQYDAAVTAATAAKSNLDTKTTELNGNTNRLNELVAKLAELDKQIQQYKTNLESQQAQMTTATDIVNRLTPGLANVGQAIEAIDRAQSTMKSEQLEASRTQLVQLKQEQETQLATNTQLLQTLAPQVEQLKTTMATAMTQQQEMKTLQQQTQQVIDQMKPVVEQMTAEHQAKTQAVAQVKPGFDQVQQRHQYLVSAIDFEKAEQALLGQLDQAWKALEQHAEVIDARQTAVAERQVAVTQQEKQLNDRQAEVNQWNQAIADKGKSKEEWNSQIVALQNQMKQVAEQQNQSVATVGKLQESLQAMTGAVETSPSDEALKATKTQLEGLVTQRQQQIEALKKQMEEMAQQVAGFQQQVATADGEIQALQQNVQKAMPVIKELQDGLQPLMAAQQQAQQELETAEQKLQELTAAYQATRGELLSLRGVESETVPVSTQ